MKDIIGEKNKDYLRYIVPIERQSLSHELDGSNGLNRSPMRDIMYTKADNDIDIIYEWLDVKVKGDSARRSYKKEAERLLAWAVVEKNKPISSLYASDLVDYELFLMDPDNQSIHKNKISWTTEKYKEITKDRDSSITVVKQKRYRRDSSGWRPFNGPLKPSSIDYTFQVLKILFSYMSNSGYLIFSPLAIKRQKKGPQLRKLETTDRYLDKNTWAFLIGFITNMRNKNSVNSKYPSNNSVSIQSKWERAEIIFTMLYMLGVRTSELANLKINSFYYNSGNNLHDKKGWMVNIFDPAGKKRQFPVQEDCIESIIEYRGNLVTSINKHVSGKSNFLEGVYPSLMDDSYVVQNLTGTKGLTSGYLSSEVKFILTEAVKHLSYCRNHGIELEDVDVSKVDACKLRASNAYWIRHTSATHQCGSGKSAFYINNAFGHKFFSTTSKYLRNDIQDNIKKMNNIKYI